MQLTKNTKYTQESTHSEMGSVRQNQIQRIVRTDRQYYQSIYHTCMHCIANCNNQTCMCKT